MKSSIKQRASTKINKNRFRCWNWGIAYWNCFITWWCTRYTRGYWQHSTSWPRSGHGSIIAWEDWTVRTASLLIWGKNYPTGKRKCSFVGLSTKTKTSKNAILERRKALEGKSALPRKRQEQTRSFKETFVPWQISSSSSSSWWDWRQDYLSKISLIDLESAPALCHAFASHG